MDEDELKGMALHQTYEADGIKILRVPNGWIYYHWCMKQEEFDIPMFVPEVETEFTEDAFRELESENEKLNHNCNHWNMQADLHRNVLHMASGQEGCKFEKNAALHVQVDNIIEAIVYNKYLKGTKEVVVNEDMKVTVFEFRDIPEAEKSIPV